MLDRYRHKVAPVAPDALIATGAAKPATERAAPAAPSAPAAIGRALAESTLEQFAAARGLDWMVARSQMIDGDVEVGAEQLAADSGDGKEQASVACWLWLLIERAHGRIA